MIHLPTCMVQIVLNFRKAAPHKTAHRQVESSVMAVTQRTQLEIGSSAAHDGFCLMLLGSPPDMVHSPPLRSTDLSSPHAQQPTPQHQPSPPGFTPAIAGCRYKAPLPPRLVRPCATLLYRLVL